METTFNCILNQINQPAVAKNGKEYQSIEVIVPAKKDNFGREISREVKTLVTIYGSTKIQKFWEGNESARNTLNLNITCYIGGDIRIDQLDENKKYYNLYLNYKTHKWIK